MHSATKFIAGHSDVMAGVLAVKGERLYLLFYVFHCMYRSFIPFLLFILFFFFFLIRILLFILFVEYMDFRKEPVAAFVALDVIACFHLQMDKKALKDRKKTVWINYSQSWPWCLFNLWERTCCSTGEKRTHQSVVLFVCDNTFGVPASSKFAFSPALLWSEPLQWSWFSFCLSLRFVLEMEKNHVLILMRDYCFFLWFSLNYKLQGYFLILGSSSCLLVLHSKFSLKIWVKAYLQQLLLMSLWSLSSYFFMIFVLNLTLISATNLNNSYFISP